MKPRYHLCCLLFLEGFDEVLLKEFYLRPYQLSILPYVTRHSPYEMHRFLHSAGWDFHRNTCAPMSVPVWRALKCANPPTLVVPSRARRMRASGCTVNGGGPRRSRSSCARRYSIIGPHLQRTQSDRYLFVIRDLACTIRSWRRVLSTTTTTTRHALGDILSHNEVNQLRSCGRGASPNAEPCKGM